MNPTSDVHFAIVCLPQPPEFDSGEAEIRFQTARDTHVGPGRVTASAAFLAGEITYDDPWKPGETTRTYTGGTPGRLIPDDEYAQVTPTASTSPTWSSEGGRIVGRSGGNPVRPHARFKLRLLTVRYSDSPVAYTRELYGGARVEFLSAFTPHADGMGASRDRIEGRGLGRRTSVRDLQTCSDDASTNLIAVVYDGDPHTGNAAQALWLSVSVLAGQNLQAIAVETYDDVGNLVERRYRPGVKVAAPAAPRFHVHYAPFEPDWLEPLVDGIAARLDEEFPIEVMIAHIHEATDGSMDRQMQSLLLAAHAASEAWNRGHGLATIVPTALWQTFANTVFETVDSVRDWPHTDLKGAVHRLIAQANNTGTAARMRAFCTALGIAFAGADKKAIDLRNPLFHDGYLRRRFRVLTYEQRQERVDQIARLRDFAFRAMLGLVDFPGRFHGALHQFKAIPVRNVDFEPDGQPSPW